MDNLEFKGTKGDWIVDYFHDERLIIKGNNFNVADCFGNLGLGFPSTDEMKANGKLIAAAPDLLELCLLVYNSFGGGDVITFSQNDIDNFEKAINKALK